VDELVRGAGISKGAFYRFYDSKESLLLALLEDHETAMHAELEASVRANPAGAMDFLIDSSVHALDRHPLLAVLMTPEGLRVLQACPAEQRARLLDRDVRMVHRVAQVMEESGHDIEVPERVLLGLLRSLVFVGLHQEEIGPDVIEDVTAWIKQALKAGPQPTAGSVTRRTHR
jgi:AcrR family transcriptional regulator